MIDIAFKNLWARKARTILSTLAVVVSVFLNGSTATMNNWMYQTMTSELARYMGKIYVQQGGSSYPPIDSSINQATADAILARDDLGLNAVESVPLIFIRTKRAMMPFMPAEEMVIGVPPGREEPLLGNVEAAAGFAHFEQDEKGRKAILGEVMASKTGAEIGHEIMLNSQPVEVVGILERSSMDSVNIAAIVPLETAQEIFGKQASISAVLLTPADVRQTSDLAEQLRADYPTLEVVTQEDMLASAEEVLEMPMFYMSTMSLTAFIVAVAVMMSTMVMAVLERTRELGTLRALGASPGIILRTILAEIVLISLIGGIPGTLLALPMATVMETTLPSPLQLVRILLFAVVAAVVGGLYPAWRAVRVQPIEALRYE